MDGLVFEGVTKRYGRRGMLALDGFSCRFPAGKLCGLVGPNGAGKTTAFSIVGGYLRPNQGSVQILGESGFDPWKLKGRLGILPQDADLGLRHTPVELLTHLGRLQGLSAADSHKEAARVLDAVGLTQRRRKRIGTLSHGMRRRVAVASALIGEPELILLDEPTAGLDPMQARDLRQTLLRRAAGQTIVVSSHNLDELERICDWVVMMDRGMCIRQGPVEEITGQRQLVVWTLGPGQPPLDELSQRLPDHEFSHEAGELVQRAPTDGDLDAASVVVAAVLSSSHIAIREVQRGRSLEKRFLEDASVSSTP